MKHIEIGTPVLVNLYGRKVRGVVAHIILSSTLPKYTSKEPRYVVYGGVAHDDGLTITVPEAFFERIDGRPNPNFKGG